MVYGPHALGSAAAAGKGVAAGVRSFVGPGVSRNRNLYRAPRTSGQLTALT